MTPEPMEEKKPVRWIHTHSYENGVLMWALEWEHSPPDFSKDLLVEDPPVRIIKVHSS